MVVNNGEVRNMCEYCHRYNDETYLRGDDGVIYDESTNRHYLFIEHFRNEVYRIDVYYCPKCGRRLSV